MQPSALLPLVMILLLAGYQWYAAKARNASTTQPRGQALAPQAPPPIWPPGPVYAGPQGPANPQGVPMPCSHCGAPMQLVSGPYLNSGLGLYCGYCRQSEPLPPDAAERFRYLQARLMQLSQARQADEAPLRTVAMIKRAWIPVLLVFLVLTAQQVYQNISIMQSLEKSAPEAVGELATPMAVGIAMFAGYLFGYLGMARGYRAAVKPLLRARPPTAPGLSVRCRGCGGSLPAVNAPEVVCGYCGAPNLLDHDVTARAGELLQAEIAAYQARAQHVYSSSAFRAPANAFYRWGAAGAVIGLVVSFVAIKGITAAVVAGGSAEGQVPAGR
jgi:hypothetical protein